MAQLKVLIIDDEKRIRSSLIQVLKLHYPNADVVGEAENIVEARVAIQQQQPDVILLDIKMPDGSGFDLLEEFLPPRFKIIFITAFDQYAVKAFKFSALDYLLKPVVPAELVKALDKAGEELNRERETLMLKTFLNNLRKEEKKIVLNTQEATHVIDVNQIIRCEADRNYTRFIIHGQKPILVSGSLKEYEDLLKPYHFIRPHHSHLVNMDFIQRLEKRNTEVLVMKDGSEVPVSVRKHPELLASLKRF